MPKVEDIDIEELEKSDPDLTGEQSDSGSAPDPEQITDRTVLERAQDVGLYPEADEEHPIPLDVAKHVRHSERDKWNH